MTSPTETAAAVPHGTGNPAAALRVLREAWICHRRMRERAIRRRDVFRSLAVAAEHYVGLSLFERAGELTLVLVERPRITLENGVPHAWDWPAVRWPDGSGRWYWRGIELPASIAERLPGLSGRDVASIRNVELRRIAVDHLGVERFLRTCGATRVAQDDFGTLWSTRLEVDGEPFVAVEVVNSTAEPDGTYRRYFLRVPFWMRTAREAVAWTFGFDRADDYMVAVQT